MRRLWLVAMAAFVGLGAVTPGSTVDTQLSSIAGILGVSEQRLDSAAAAEQAVDNTLGGLATTYAELIATVNGYVTDDGVSDDLEKVRQQRLAERIAERAVLKDRSSAAVVFQAALTTHGATKVKAALAGIE